MADAPLDLGLPEEEDPWEEADRAWEATWADDASDAERDPDAQPDDMPLPPGAEYQPVTPTAGSVRDAYGDGMREAGPYLGLGAQIGGSMAIFIGGGLLVDRWLDSSPWGVLVGAALGMIGIIALVVRIANDAGSGKK